MSRYFLNLFGALSVNRTAVPPRAPSKGILLVIMANSQGAARLVAFSAALLLLITSVAAPASAQDEERVAVVELELLREAGGAVSVPIRVTVVSRRAVDAELEVRASGVNMSWRFPLALAANTEVQQIVVVPTDGGSLGQVDATLLSGDDSLATARNQGREGNENAVGLLGIEAPAGEVRLNPDIGVASLIELDDLRLLPALDSMVTTPAALRALAAEEQNVLLSWVWSGKQLLVADESGSIDAWLPDPVADGRSNELVGAGIVRYVGRDWDEHVYPGITVATQPGLQVQGAVGQNTELLNDGGFSVPSLRVMTIVLLLYLLIAGPLTFGILTSKNKQSLVWIVLPALAVLFTTGVFVGGKLLNSGRTDAYAAIVEVNPVGGSRTETLLLSRSGRQTIDVPETYTVVGTGSSSFRDFDFGPNGGGGGTPIVQRPSRTTTELEFRIDTGSGGTAIVSGLDATAADQLTIEDLSISNDMLSGSVRNASSETLEQTTVVVANRTEIIGSLPAGDSATFEVNLAGPPGRFGAELRAWEVDPRDRWNFDGREEANDALKNGPVNGTSWLEWRASKFGADGPAGLVTVVGWSRELDALRDGTGRTALVARAELPETSEPVRPAQLRTFRVQAPNFGGFDEIAFEAGAVDVAHFVRHPGADTSELALQFPRGASELSLWIEDEWRWFEVDEDTASSIELPEEAWIDDTLTVRLRSNNFDGNPSFVTVIEPTAQTAQVELGPPGEKRERRNRFEDEGFGGPLDGFEQRREAVPVNFAADSTQFEFVEGGVIEGGYDTWELPLLEGDDVTVEMRKFDGQLDPFLVVKDPKLIQIADDDDSGGDLNSRLTFRAEEDGTYLVETRPLGDNGFGDYEVTITIDREPVGDSDG